MEQGEKHRILIIGLEIQGNNLYTNPALIWRKIIASNDYLPFKSY